MQKEKRKRLWIKQRAVSSRLKFFVLAKIFKLPRLAGCFFAALKKRSERFKKRALKFAKKGKKPRKSQGLILYLYFGYALKIEIIKLKNKLLWPFKKRWQRAAASALLFVLVIASLSVYYYGFGTVKAATYNWTQTDWSGGESATYPNHTANQSGWTNYASSDNDIATSTPGQLSLKNQAAALSARTNVTQNWQKVTAIDNASATHGRKIAIATSTGVVYIAYHSKEYNATYFNVALRSSSDNFASRTDITTSTSADCLVPAIAVDPTNIVHMAYVCGTNTMYYANSSNWANKTSLGTGSYPAIAASGSEVYVVYAYSGAKYRKSSNWGTAVSIASTTSSYSPSIAVDSSGVFYVAYYSMEYNASKYNIAYRNSNNWYVRTDISTSTAVSNQYPSIAVDSTNKVHIAYQSNEYDATHNNIVYRNSDNWVARTDVSTSTTLNFNYPSIAVDSTGKAYVAYVSREYNISYDNIAYRSSDSWGTVRNITANSNKTSQYPFIAIDASDKIHAVYQSNELSSMTNIAYRTNAAGNFNTRVDVTGSWFNDAYTDYNNGKKIALAPNGTVYIAYYSYEYNSAKYNIALRSSADNFAARTDISTSTTADNKFPSIAVDSNGKVHIAYTSYEFNATYSNIAYRNSDNWDARVDVTSSASRFSAYPSIAVDSNNKVHIVYDSQEYNGTYNVAYRNNVSDNFVTRTDVTAISSASEHYPSIAVDSNGKVHISYQSYEYNTGANNIAYRNNISGSFASRVDVSTSTTIISVESSIAVDSNGKAHIAYRSKDYSDGGVYNVAYRNNVSNNFFARIDISTTTATNGLAASISVDSGDKVHIVYQSMEYNGNYNVAYRNSNNWGRRMDITTASTNALWPSVAVDSAGKLYIAYHSKEYNVNVFNIAYLTYQPGGYSNGYLTSSYYNSEQALNIVGGISWNEDASLPAATAVKLQIQTAPDSAGAPGAGTGFIGPDGTVNTYFTNSASGCSKNGTTVTCTITSALVVGDGANDQWIQYKIFLDTDSSNTATVADISVTYVVNAPPSIQNVTATQVSKNQVTITYDIKDIDTDTGSLPPTGTRNFVTPSFEYSLDNGTSWSAISTTTITFGAAPPTGQVTDTDSDGDMDNKVLTSSFLTYTAYWDAKTTLPNSYSTQAKVRVTVNDNEAANNTASSSTGSAFTLDTKNPTSPSVAVVASSSPASLALSASDDSAMQMKIALSENGLNSASWQTYNATSSITLSTDPSTVYVLFKDAFGNTTATTTATTPETPSSVMLQDTSNVSTAEYRLFIAWKVVAAPGPGFSQYQVYRSADSVSYSLLGSVSAIGTNFYTDTTVAYDTMYYYKIATKDSSGNVSYFSTAKNGKPNGAQDAGEGGGGTDTTPPVITNVATSSVSTTQATITWDTNEASDSRVDYITSVGGDFAGADYVGVNSMKDVNPWLGQHSVTLSNLTPGTTYYFQVKSTDVALNTATDKLGTDGYSFTTLAGPAISNTTTQEVSNNTARISWLSTTPADSYVIYSTNSNLTSRATSSLDTLDTSHDITLTGLTQGTKYYYYVQSSDASHVTAYDKNVVDGVIAYYTFTTTSDITPPVISNISSLASTTSAIITWDTNEMSDSKVQYGLTTAYGQEATSTTDTVKHYLTADSLTPGSTYHYRVISVDVNGNGATSTDKTFLSVASALVETVPPVITNISASPIYDTVAVINWETDEIANSTVLYGMTDALGATASSATTTIAHAVALTGLTANNSYFYKVQSTDQAGNTTLSALKTFTTLEVLSTESQVVSREEAAKTSSSGGGGVLIVTSSGGDRTPPTISEIGVSGVKANSAVVSWKTDESANSFVKYGETIIYDNRYGDYEYTTLHKASLNNLSPSTTYHFMAASQDSSGNLAQSFDQTFTTPSLLEEITQPTPGGTNPSEPAVNQENVIAAAFKKAMDVVSQAARQVSVGVLESTLNSQFDFMQKLAESVPAPLLSGEPKVVVTSDTATVSWRTNKDANSLVAYASEDAYLANPGAASLNQVVGEHKLETKNHIVVVENLKPDTTYYYQVRSEIALGPSTQSGIFTFRTNPKGMEISSYMAQNISDEKAIFKWATNVEANSEVKYTPYRKNILSVDEQRNKLDKAYSLIHEIPIDDFEAGTVYQVELAGRDRRGNIISKIIPNFITAKDGAAAEIYQVQSSSAISMGKTDTIQTIISWMSSKSATSRIYWAKGIGNETEITANSTPLDQAYVKKHMVIITKFEPGAIYRFQAESIDTSGNKILSKIYTILTPRRQETVFDVIKKNFVDVFGWTSKVGK